MADPTLDYHMPSHSAAERSALWYVVLSFASLLWPILLVVGGLVLLQQFPSALRGVLIVVLMVFVPLPLVLAGWRYLRARDKGPVHPAIFIGLGCTNLLWLALSIVIATAAELMLLEMQQLTNAGLPRPAARRPFPSPLSPLPFTPLPLGLIRPLNPPGINLR